MTLQYRAPEPTGDDWKTWARRMMQYLGQTRIPLVQQTGDESAADDGQLMWDRSTAYPVVSKGGEWQTIALGATTTLKNPVFSYTGGVLTSIAYDDSNSKALTYNGDGKLNTLATTISGATTIKTMAYNADGTLASVTET